MIPLVEETISGKVKILLENIKSNKVIYNGTGYSTGVEYGGDMMNIFDN